MDDLQADNQEAEDEIAPLPPKNPRRQRQQLRFAEGEEEEKPLSNFKPPGRASRLLSIRDPSTELPGESLLRLQQLHNQATHGDNSLFTGEISDELLDKLPFKIEIIPDRRDDFDASESTLTKSRQKNQEPAEVPTIVSSGLTQKRRLEIIEEILKRISQNNVLDEIRRASALPFRLPRKNQLQKNVATHIRDLTGSELVMLNDPFYMKNLCQRLDEKHQEQVEANFERIASNGKL